MSVFFLCVYFLAELLISPVYFVSDLCFGRLCVGYFFPRLSIVSGFSPSVSVIVVSEKAYLTGHFVVR